MKNKCDGHCYGYFDEYGKHAVCNQIDTCEKTKRKEFIGTIGAIATILFLISIVPITIIYLILSPF